MREQWNSSYLVGGNYWDTYTGADNNGDNIGDTEYAIDESNTDYYPLIAPIDIPALEVPPALPEFVPNEPEEPEQPETPTEPEEPETPTEHEEPEQPTTKELAISTEVLVIVAVATICV